MARRNDFQMRRVHKEAMEEEFRQADLHNGKKITNTKGNTPMIKETIKSQTQKSFETEEDLQLFLVQNPQYEINQRIGTHTRMINVEFYERGFAEMGLNSFGQRAVNRWLTDEEAQAYLENLKK